MEQKLERSGRSLWVNRRGNSAMTFVVLMGKRSLLAPSGPNTSAALPVQVDQTMIMRGIQTRSYSNSHNHNNHNPHHNALI